MLPLQLRLSGQISNTMKKIKGWMFVLPNGKPILSSLHLKKEDCVSHSAFFESVFPGVKLIRVEVSQVK